MKMSRNILSIGYKYFSGGYNNKFSIHDVGKISEINYPDRYHACGSSRPRKRKHSFAHEVICYLRSPFRRSNQIKVSIRGKMSKKYILSLKNREH